MRGKENKDREEKEEKEKTRGEKKKIRVGDLNTLMLSNICNNIRNKNLSEDYASQQG